MKKNIHARKKYPSISVIQAKTQIRIIVKGSPSATAPSSTPFYLEESGTSVWFALRKQATREDDGLACLK